MKIPPEVNRTQDLRQQRHKIVYIPQKRHRTCESRTPAVQGMTSSKATEQEQHRTIRRSSYIFKKVNKTQRGANWMETYLLAVMSRKHERKYFRYLLDENLLYVHF